MNIKVRSGDTLWYYSQLFMIPIQLIIDSNQNVDSNSLQVGQVIKVPGFTTNNYTIKQNDTFWKIARERNLSIDAILLLNQELNPNQLQVGRTIKVPRRMVTSLVQRGKRYDSSRLFRDIGELREAYPFIEVNTIGESVLGKPLYEIKLGRGSKKVHLNASFHANEWITSPIIMTLLNSYLLSLTNNSPIRGLNMLNLYNQVELSIVPMVNPDGVDLVLNGPPEAVREEVININKGSTDFTGWKANINGVDLNNQYPAKWEIEKERKEPKSPAPRDYPGDAPLTEPEAIAMADLASREGFNRMLAFHTQGEEFYWGYEGLEPPESRVLATEFERVSGYQAIQNIDSHAGFKDWFIKEFRRPAFTLELGRGINPLPLSQFDQIYEKVLGIFLASLYM
ncbi:M14 family metallopeptidase (plasmid) [Bacillus sp. 31A1R]|uniref:M14 family metallopeptidase n=1 Tax=Robertmurraya mangrovi TaxID=3098077 RepID=A0ABU5IV28_9BACI|nr:M14 family metallopeptidase [Bacillus sp. 31A1R]MDZ5471006.1 M14 family metallopeptidase [Bacillus sp. 31A1R]